MQLSADGVPLLFHDDSPARTTNVEEVLPGSERDPIMSFTWGELQQFDAGSSFGEKVAGERIPHLDDADDVPGDDVRPGSGEHVLLVDTGRTTVDVGGDVLRNAANNLLTVGEGYEPAPGERLRMHTGPGTDVEDASAKDGTSSVPDNGGGGPWPSGRTTGGCWTPSPADGLRSRPSPAATSPSGRPEGSGLSRARARGLRWTEAAEAEAMEPVIEIDEDDLYGLIAALTHSDWQPSGGTVRINVVYRGHALADRDLHTSLYRLRGDSSDRIEPHILRNFRKYAARDTSPGDSDWNWLSVAQHHGLPTRLLDWSNSPYVALHFVTADPRCYDRPGAVWCVDYAAVHELLPPELGEEIAAHEAGLFTTGMLTQVAYSMADFDRYRDADGRPVPLFFEPPSLDERIVNQAAVFSAMSGATASLHEWLTGHPELYRKVVIPPALKWRIRDHLDQANMTERVLFPGLDGLCQWLGRYYGPRPELGETIEPAPPGLGGEPDGRVP